MTELRPKRLDAMGKRRSESVVQVFEAHLSPARRKVIVGSGWVAGGYRTWRRRVSHAQRHFWSTLGALRLEMKSARHGNRKVPRSVGKSARLVYYEKMGDVYQIRRSLRQPLCYLLWICKTFAREDTELCESSHTEKIRFFQEFSKMEICF